MILYAALLLVGGLGYFLGYRRGLARGRFETTEAHVAAKMVDYGMAVYPAGRGCPVCQATGRI